MTAPVSQNIVWHEGVTQEQREELTGQRGVTIWFTGLSGQSSLFYRSPCTGPQSIRLKLCGLVQLYR